MKRINILITDEQHKRLLEHAKQTEISISEQIRRAIEKYMGNMSEDGVGVKKCIVCGCTATNVFFQRKDQHSNQINEIYVCDEHLNIFEEI